MMNAANLLKALCFEPSTRVAPARMADSERQASAPAYNVHTRTELAADRVMAVAREFGALVRRTGPEDVYVDPTPNFVVQVGGEALLKPRRNLSV